MIFKRSGTLLTSFTPLVKDYISIFYLKYDVWFVLKDNFTVVTFYGVTLSLGDRAKCSMIDGKVCNLCACKYKVCTTLEFYLFA